VVSYSDYIVNLLTVFQHYATTLVMKLQLLTQEVNNVIEETSQEVVSNLPRVLRDIEVVKQEALLLQEQVSMRLCIY